MIGLADDKSSEPAACDTGGGPAYGLWALHNPNAYTRLIGPLLAARRSTSASPSAARQTFKLADDGIAIVEMTGILTKRGTIFGNLPHGTVGVRNAIRAAAADDSVRGIMLVIDSPGGTVQGTGDLARDVATAAGRKPLFAFIEDVGASAAFWVASQAEKLFANDTAVVGSIGIFEVIRDSSKGFEKDGIKTHVVSSAPLKGDARGAKVSADELDDTQRVVNEIQAKFTAGVAQGRGISLDAAEKLADGRVHIGANAQRLGFVDKIATLDEAMDELRSRVGLKASQTKPRAASKESRTAPVATIAKAEPTKPKIKWPPSERDKRNMARIARGNEWRRDEAERRKQTAAATSLTERENEMTAKTEWDRLVVANIEAGMPRARAVSEVVKDNPELHKRFVAEAQTQGRCEASQRR